MEIINCDSNLNLVPAVLQNRALEIYVKKAVKYNNGKRDGVNAALGSIRSLFASVFSAIDCQFRGFSVIK